MKTIRQARRVVACAVVLLGMAHGGLVACSFLDPLGDDYTRASRAPDAQADDGSDEWVDAPRGLTDSATSDERPYCERQVNTIYCNDFDRGLASTAFLS